MRSHIVPNLLVCLVIGLAHRAGGTPPTDDEGFVVLYHARRDADPQAGTPTGAGILSPQRYRNFILQIAFKPNTSTASLAVRVCVPEKSADVEQGQLITIAWDTLDGEATVSVPNGQPQTGQLKPQGAWNQLEITYAGRMADIRLNDEPLVRRDGPPGMAGYVIVEPLDTVGTAPPTVSYQTIRIKPLPDDARAYHVLFDGMDIDRWNLLTRTGGFTLEKDQRSVTTTGRGLGLLWYPRIFQDFILLLDWKVTKASDNSGVYLRFPDPTRDPLVVDREGYEIQINDSGGARRRTGSICKIQDADGVASYAVGKWNHLEVRAVGQEYTVLVNGQVVNQFTGARNTAGYVGLQCHNSPSQVSFRRIRVVELGD